MWRLLVELLENGLARSVWWIFDTILPRFSKFSTSLSFDSLSGGYAIKWCRCQWITNYFNWIFSYTIETKFKNFSSWICLIDIIGVLIVLYLSEWYKCICFYSKNSNFRCAELSICLRWVDNSFILVFYFNES